MLLNARMILVCKQMCHPNRDALKAQLEANRAQTEQYINTVEQLRLKLQQSLAAGEEAKQLQAQQGLEIEKLKAALANAIAHLRNERAAKQQALKQRYAKRKSK